MCFPIFFFFFPIFQEILLFSARFCNQIYTRLVPLFVVMVMADYSTGLRINFSEKISSRITLTKKKDLF